MSYAQAVRVFSNPVDTMFGLVSRKGVHRAVNQAREDVRQENARQYDADVQEVASFVRTEASKASRPAPKTRAGNDPKPAPSA